jgi:hypothetical protein
MSLTMVDVGELFEDEHVHGGNRSKLWFQLGLQCIFQAQHDPESQQSELGDHGLVEHKATIPSAPPKPRSTSRDSWSRLSWREALLMLIANVAPTREIGTKPNQADEMVPAGALAATLLGAERMPRFPAASDKQNPELRLIHCE